MPIIDMPLEELKVYQGRNPKPDDFDAYWDKALAEMRAVDPQVELKKAAFTAPGDAVLRYVFYRRKRRARLRKVFKARTKQW